ncbi:MAG: sigma-70 family RNA polymerase sigma factor [Akkermansiaceae bacterium]|nr:sigma-70 family RNA polymerase sigma factor [Akkermansiaceae bacterium]
MTEDANRFRTTRWTVLRDVSSAEEASAAKALSVFCGIYRAPLLAFTKATIPDPQDAEDYVQGFFEKLMERNFLRTADPDRGRLRTFLLTCLKRHIADERRKKDAAKRGGGIREVPLDEAGSIPADTPGPDELYHRQWIHLLLGRSVTRLRDAWAAAGKADLFAALTPWLGFAPESEEDRAALATRLGMTKGSLKTCLYRLRKEYREILMEEISETLEEKTPDRVMEEMKQLLALV